MSDPYVPIDCSWYDQFELWCMRSSLVSVVLHSGEAFQGVIADLKTESDGEFALWADGRRSRLDEIERIFTVSEGSP